MRVQLLQQRIGVHFIFLLQIAVRLQLERQLFLLPGSSVHGIQFRLAGTQLTTLQ